MPYLYHSADNSAGTAVNFPGTQAGDDVVIDQIIVGTPQSSRYIAIYDLQGAIVASHSAYLAYKTTLPGTLSTGSNFSNITFPNGLHLGNGGSIVTDSAMQVTVLYHLSDDTNK